ncbi:MAG: protein translocase subunit SecD [Planctomyces sp.]|nr:protein translocase subunit SecD [Planctomyces sp.]
MSLLLNGLLILCLQAAGTGAEAASGVNQAQPPAAAAPGAPAAEQAAPAAAPAAAQPPAVTAAPADPAAAAAPPVTAPADATTAAAAGEVTTSEEKSLPPAATGPGGFVILLLVLAILILPFVIGSFVAKSLNVPEWSSRIGVVILTLLLGISPFLMSLLKGQPLSERFRLGIDLAGGTNMVFQVRGEGKEITPSVMDQMVGAVSRRINQSGTEEITVRAVGTDRIEVIVPGEDPQTVDDIKRRITRLGSLEFFTVANRADSDIIRLAQGLDLSRKEVVINGEVRARWVPAAEKNGEPKLLTDSDVISRPLKAEREVNGRVESYDTQEYLLLVSPKEEQVTGQYLRSAVRDFDPQNGEIVVSFAFDQTGAYLFGQLTGRNVPRDGVPNRRLAIVLDGRVDSAPFIREQITSRGQISGGQGGFTAEEAGELVAVLNAGALEVPIDPKPLSEATVDPTLGADVRQKGVTATAISGLAVIVFMLVYYRFAGLIAVISLILNLVLTVGLMVAIPATFTLPGIAGLVLTIGMAVDANVLIYERMREEIDRGSSTRIAIQNGFEKAFITIFDSNVTTLLTSVVLFYFGTDQIRGFAVTLFIGLAVSMYTALYVGRLLFDLSERCGLLKQISMMRAIGETNLDFMKYRNHLFTVSGVLIAIGLLFFGIRGEKNYDIDFTGGTMVAFQTTEPQKTDDVTAVLQQEFGDDFALERLSVGEESGEGTGKYFRLRTTDRETSPEGAEAQVSAEDRVRERVNKAFSGNSAIKLRMVSLEVSPVKPVVTDAADNSVAAVARMKFKDGSESDLKFTEELAFGTATDLVAEALSAVRKADSGDLIGLEGTAGSGMEGSERSVKKFSSFTVRVLPDVTSEQLTQALSAVQQQLSATPLFDEVNTFASAVARETRVDATIAVLLSILGISAYIWFRFQNLIFGLAAVVSLVHDVLITLGSLAVASTISGTGLGDLLLIDDFRINLSMIAAFLTLVGYSLNDTIVVFDRIREVRGKNPLVTSAIVNTSLNQTLGRTLMTGVTVFIVVVILYVFGGSGVHGFAWCLLIGSIAGTYSSVYIASPFLVWFLGQTKSAKA